MAMTMLGRTKVKRVLSEGEDSEYSEDNAIA
jgi:hypothetical protein